jgi:hypothetical protein
MFSTAKKIAAPKAPKKDTKAQVAIDGLATLASIDAVMKSLAALKATVESDVKSAMAVEFVTTGCAIKKRPENFRGTDEGASASCELRIRSSASALSEDEQKLYAEAGIGTKTVVSTIETYVINPEYKDNGDLLALVEKKLKGIKGIPEDFIMFQEGVSKTVAADDALDVLFTLPAEKARDLLPIVGTLAVKPKLDTDDVAEAFKVVGALLGDEE